MKIIINTGCYFLYVFVLILHLFFAKNPKLEVAVPCFLQNQGLTFK